MHAPHGLELVAFVRRGAFLGQMMTMMILGAYLQSIIIQWNNKSKDVPFVAWHVLSVGSSK